MFCIAELLFNYVDRYSLQFDGTVYTFGFGSDHDATLLEAISTQGGGVYYYIDSNEKVPSENMIIIRVHHVSLYILFRSLSHLLTAWEVCSV